MGVHTRHRTPHQLSPLTPLRWLSRHGTEVEVFGWVTLVGAGINYTVFGAALGALALAVVGVVAMITGLYWRGLAG